MIIPEKLNVGDTVGIICPSAGINSKAKHRIDRAKLGLEKMGYKVKLGKHLLSDNYTAGSIEERVEDFHDMFRDQEVRAIIAAIGGNHSNHLLRFLNYDLIRQNPKIFMGYSDITVLHYALQTQSKLATYYGPCAVTQFAEFPEILPYTQDSFLDNVFIRAREKNLVSSETWTDEFLDWFQKKDLTRARKQHLNEGHIWLKHGVGEGEALPACNFSMNRLAGTRFWINPSNKVLFLDLVLDSLDYPLLDASLTDLYNVGVFDDLSGLILSRPSGFSDEQIELVYQRILDFAKGKTYPIVANFNIGHTDPIKTIRYGQKIKIDSKLSRIIAYN